MFLSKQDVGPPDNISSVRKKISIMYCKGQAGSVFLGYG